MDTEKIYNLFLEIKTDIHDKHTDLKKEINKNSLDATILKEKIIKLENNDIELKKELSKQKEDMSKQIDIKMNEFKKNFLLGVYSIGFVGLLFIINLILKSTGLIDKIFK